MTEKEITIFLQVGSTIFVNFIMCIVRLADSTLEYNEKFICKKPCLKSFLLLLYEVFAFCAKKKFEVYLAKVFFPVSQK